MQKLFTFGVFYETKALCGLHRAAKKCIKSVTQFYQLLHLVLSLYSFMDCDKTVINNLITTILIACPVPVGLINTGYFL